MSVDFLLMLDVMSGEDPKMTRFVAAVSAYVAGGDFLGAETLMSRLHSELPKSLCPRANVFVFNLMIQECGRRRLSERAYYWFGALCECGVTPNSHTFSSLLNVCVECGDEANFRKFRRMFRDLKTPLNECSYNTIIKWHASTGDVEGAANVLKEMLVTGVSVSAITFNSVINACTRAKRLDLAETCMSLMWLTGVRANTITYNSIMDTCAVLGLAGHAEWWFQDMSLFINTQLVQKYENYEKYENTIFKNACR
jgi:pentatricopeptide repeat protein